ncbi:MAG TPA: hypothetical protein VLF18_01930 [Tahibacter sp.]|uniref:hypothetical protein n=1 Tax=Tahibacter sp. TaxID=2056211 RepID=UPI002CFD3C94|nr:hypothetical protein [Tahibacter sp.]HSX58935.1 hypothetical protein [Tahibacter sp.]
MQSEPASATTRRDATGEPADLDRRSLLKAMLVGAGLAACPLSSAIAQALAAPEGSDRVFADGFEPAPGGRMGFSVRAPGAQAQAPVALGFAFRRGDVPAGSSVTANQGALQVTPRNYWPDGSLKFAQLVWRGAVNAAPTFVQLSAGSAGSGTALTLADLQATGVTASIACGAYGTVSWSGSDWAAPFAFESGQSAWISGPLMSSWIYRKAVGSDPHLVAWLEVRLYAGGAVDVLPWIENGYLKVAAPASKAATFTFTLGGTQRFSAAVTLPHHCRTPLVSGAALSHWLAGDPQISVQHDAAYLMASELVPTYRANVAANAPVVSALPAAYVPLQQGSFTFDGDGMTASGYQEPIGLLPQHDVLYLTSPGVAYAAVVRNGFSAGRYPIHYRDETTNRPIRFTSHPTLGISNGSGFHDNGASGSYTPTPSGAAPRTWDCAHSPSVGFMAYVVTGRWYFLEEMQFAATANHLGKGSVAALRDGAKGLVKPEVGAWQTRAAAWQWRTLAQAAALTPDVDATLATEFRTVMQYNVDNLYDTYIAQPNNPFGFIQSAATYGNGGTAVVPPWQQDFFTAATGYAIALQAPMSDAHRDRLAGFFAWTARSIVGRLGVASGFWYINGDPYVLRISNAVLPNYQTGAGPWFANWSEAYAALPAALTTASAPNGWLGSTEGTLCGEIMPGERAMWGNLQPAIAYAVRFGVSGALAAYQRMTGATNWNAFVNALNVAPVWSVAPATGAAQMPAWLAGAPLDTWIEIPGTALTLGPLPVFGGFAVRASDSTLVVAAAGGHQDSSNNAVASIRLSQDAPAWVLRQTATANPTPNPVSTWGYEIDGKPSPMHLYHSLQYIPAIDAVLRLNPRYTWPGAHDLTQAPQGFNDAFALNSPPNLTDASGWAGRGVHPASPGGASDYALCVDANGRVWTSTLRRYDPATRTWMAPVASSGISVRFPGAYDSSRRQVVTLQWGDSQGAGSGWSIGRIPIDGNAQITLGINPSAAFTALTNARPQYPGFAYDPNRDEFLVIAGGSWTGSGASLIPDRRIFVLKPNATNTWDLTERSIGGAAWTCRNDGVNARLHYLPQFKGFVFQPDWTQNLLFCRTAV